MCRYCWPDAGPDHRERNVYREDDEFDAPHKKRGKGNKSSPNQKGCPASGGKAHVYVWIEFQGIRRAVVWKGEGKDRYAVNGNRPTTWWERRCIGCDHRNNRKFSWGSPPQNIYEVRKVNHDWW